MRCLLIEDHTPLRKYVQECLVEEGFVVDASAAGDEGLWFARNHRYDAIVLDFMLPGVPIHTRRGHGHLLSEKTS